MLQPIQIFVPHCFGQGRTDPNTQCDKKDSGSVFGRASQTYFPQVHDAVRNCVLKGLEGDVLCCWIGKEGGGPLVLSFDHYYWDYLPLERADFFNLKGRVLNTDFRPAHFCIFKYNLYQV